ncbi:MAG: ABC transporter ATP-binding protein [Deltaproteobacteria bacterium]|nr:ABC transporter ATP-binding protein [Deltaproteobacteria bacterium]
MNEPLLKVEKIDVSYSDVKVLHDIDLEVYPTEIVTVIGPNGAGKSTLLSAIMGFEIPNKGSVIFNGKKITGTPPEKTVELGMTIVPEGARVFTEMTVLDNLKMGSYIKSSRVYRKSSFEMVFNFFPRLHERLKQKGGTLSGGERQMLAIGRALMSRPSLLLLDEPSLGLAPLLVTKVFETIVEIAATGLTVLLVEQNVHFSLEISKRAYVLENGRIVKNGFSEELMNNDYIKKSYLAL